MSQSSFNSKTNDRGDGDDGEKDEEELEIDEESLLRHMCTHGLPDPDLLIRTSGNLTLTNLHHLLHHHHHHHFHHQ